MPTRVKLTLNEFESRQMMDAVPVVPPPDGTGTVATQTAEPVTEVAAPVIDQATLNEFDRYLDMVSDAGAVISSFDAALQAGGEFPGLTVTGVGAGLTTDGFGSASPQAVVLIYVQPKPGEEAGLGDQIMIYRPDPGANNADTLYGIKDRLVRGAVGAGAGAATGATTGAVCGLIGGPLAVVTAGAGAIGGTVVGGIYGVFFADDIVDAGVGGAVGGVGGAAVGGVGRAAIIAGRGVLTAEGAAAAAAATARHQEMLRQEIARLNQFLLNNAGSTDPIVKDQVYWARLRLGDAIQILNASSTAK